MTWVSDSAGVMILGSAFAAVLAVAEAWARAGHALPEWPRKLVHAAGGGVCLFFPFLISSAWVVLCMALLLSAVFVAGRRVGALRCLHGVDRHTRGAEYYPVSVFLLFMLSADTPWLFVSSMLVLAVSDAFAAVIGSSYGRIRYAVGDGSKSLEGSAAFLVVSFLVIHLPMLLMTEHSRALCVLAALLVAILVTGFEALSTRGVDNLFVPLGTCVILGKLSGKSESELVFQLVSLLALCSVIAVTAWRCRTFDAGGAIALVLFVFGAWSLGSVVWAFPALLGIALFVMFWVLTREPKWNAGGVNARLVAHAVALPMVLVVCANSTASYAFVFGPYLASLAVVFSFAFWKHLQIHAAGKLSSRMWALAGCCAGAWTVTALLPSAVLSAGNRTTFGLLAVVLAVCLTAGMHQQACPRPSEAGLWRASDFMSTAAAAGLAALLQYTRILPAWRGLP